MIQLPDTGKAERVEVMITLNQMLIALVHCLHCLLGHQLLLFAHELQLALHYTLEIK